MKTLRDYALGSRSFSTPFLAATITATWLTGSGFASLSHLWQNKSELAVCISRMRQALFVGFSPAIIHQLLLARSFLKVKKTFFSAALLHAFILAGIVALSIFMVVKYEGLPVKDILLLLIKECAYPGLNGVVIIGIMAMVMSTEDSYINTASVLFANDFLKPMQIANTLPHISV